MVDEDFRRKAVGQAQGAAIKFTDIDGIGPSTRDKIKDVILDKGGKVQAPRDVADMSAEELSEKAGISKSRAEKAIKGGGGNPQFSDTGSTGTTEAGNIANALDSATEQSAQIVNEREDFFSQLVETGEQIPDQRERRNNPESIPFYDRDTEEVRELGQAADIFSKATAEPISPTAEKPDTGFDDEAREKAAEVKLAAGRVLEEREGLDFQEATSETRGSPENTPNFGVVESVLGFGATSTVGQFEVSESGQEQAREAYADQSREAKQVDSRRRAPVTTDADTYSRNPGELDFPGVDTPSKDPKTLPKDYKKGGRPDTTDPDEQSQAAQTSGFDAFPEAAAGGSMEDAFMAEMAGRDVPASPDEVTRGVGAVSPNALGGNFMNEGERAPSSEPEAPSNTALRRQQRKQGKGLKSGDTGAGDIAFIYQNEGRETGMSLAEFRRRTKRKKRQMGGAADDFAAARMVAKDNKPEQQPSGGNDRVTVDVPDQTLATLRTGLNERTDDYFDNFEPENQDRLTSIKERISIGEPLELSPGEFQDAKRILKDERDRAEDRAERMDRNIFGDTSEQAERANAAFQGLISNPPGF